MKVAIYVRVSTAEQTTENQKIRLIEYCKKQGWEYDLYEEVMSSRKSRPVKQELLGRLRAGKYAGILVFKLDRFARSSHELIMNIKEIIDRGYQFHSLTENLDFGTASGRLQFQILSAFAEFERSLISERTIEGLRRAKLNGKQPGRPKGSRDKKKRRKAGYLLREAGKRQAEDQSNGIYKGIENYVS